MLALTADILMVKNLNNQRQKGKTMAKETRTVGGLKDKFKKTNENKIPFPRPLHVILPTYNENGKINRNDNGLVLYNGHIKPRIIWNIIFSKEIDPTTLIKYKTIYIEELNESGIFRIDEKCSLSRGNNDKEWSFILHRCWEEYRSPNQGFWVNLRLVLKGRENSDGVIRDKKGIPLDGNGDLTVGDDYIIEFPIVPIVL